nr:hypothetical protein [Tanacetum cinerariifolium]
MDITIDQQVALDEALVPHASRLRIGKSNFRLRLDITSKESTLQVVYNVLRLTPFYKEFLVIVDVPEIHMQEFWAITTTFDELPFEEEILTFLRYLGHSGEIKKITDVNINKLHQPWRSFAAIINKCLSGKSTGYDSLRFTKVITNFFMTKDPSVPRRNEFGAMLLVELTNEDIRNSAAYKEYYVIASGAAPPKTKASVRKMHSSSDTTMPPSTAAGIRLSTLAKGKQPAKSSKTKGLSVLSEVALTEAEQIKLATKRSLQQTHISQASGSGADEGTGIIPGVPNVPTDESDEEISWKSSDEDDDYDVDDKSEADDDDDQEDEDEQDDDDQDNNDDDQDSDNDGDHFVHPKLSTHEEEAKDEESRDVQMIDVHTTQVLEDTHVTLTPVNPDGQQQSSSMSSQFVTSKFNPSPDACIDSLFETTHEVDVPVSTTIVPLLVTAPTLPSPSIPIMSQVQKAPTPTPTTAPSSFLQDLLNFGSLFGFDHRLKTLEANFSEFMQTNQLRDEAQAENEDFVNKLDENIQKIIKEQVKEQVKIQVSKILPKIEKTVNEQLEAEVLTRSSNSSKTSYAVVADLSELELKKILIEKMESNKRRDDADKDKEPSAGSDRGSKRRRERKEPESTSAPKEKASKTTGAADDQPIAEASQHPEWFQKQTKPPTPDRAWNKTLPGTHGSIQPWISDLTKQADSRALFNELMDTPVDFSAFLMNRLNVDTLTPELLAEVYQATTDQLDWNNPEGHQYPHNLLKPLPLIPNSRGLRVIPFDQLINNDVEYLCGGASSRKYTTFVMKTKASDYGHIKWIEDLIIEWHDYKHLNWITVRRDNDKLYKFKEGDFKRLRIKDIKDMLLLLHSHLTTCGRSSIRCRKLPKKLNLIKQDTCMTYLKRKEAYTAYSNPRGFIYQNKDKQNRLMQIDELHKFSDVTLNDVQTALDYCLKDIRMKYPPQTI